MIHGGGVNMGLPDNCAVKLQNKFAKGGKNLITDVPGVKEIGRAHV